MKRRDLLIVILGIPLLIAADVVVDGLKKIVFGNKPLIVKDPRKLLAAARKSQKTSVTKTTVTVWDTYGWPPVVTELALQNEMSNEELIDYLKDADYGEDKFNPWLALYELPIVLSNVPDWAREQIVEDAVHDVAVDVEMALLEQFPELRGIEI